MKTIEYAGKKIEVDTIFNDFVVAKTGKTGTKTYYLLVNGEWKYRHEPAMSGLRKKFKDEAGIGKACKDELIGTRKASSTPKEKKVKETTTTKEPKKPVKGTFVKVANGICKLEPIGWNDALAKVSWKATDL